MGNKRPVIEELNSNIRFADRLSFQQARYGVFVALLLGLLFSLLLIWQDYRYASNNFDKTLLRILNVVSHSAAQAAYSLDDTLAREVSEGLFKYSPIIQVRIVDYTGVILVDNSHVPPKKEEAWWLINGIFGGDRLFIVPLKIALQQGKDVGELQVRVDTYLAARRFFKQSLLIIVSGIIRNILLSIILIALFNRMVSKPLFHLVKDLANINPAAPGRVLVPEIPNHKSDELGLLVKQTNHLLTELQYEMNLRKEGEMRIDESEKRLQMLTYYDAVTELPNRHYFTDILDKAILRANRNNTEFALLMLDLDNFKNINDSMGHSNGDLLLQQIAIRLTKNVRRVDMVARNGGDEFLLLFQDIEGIQYLNSQVLQLITAISKPIQLNEAELRITASMGICLYPHDGEDAAMLFRNVDTALYKAKEEGRNTYHFYTEKLTQSTLERVSLENDLRRALDAGQFRLFYQPQFSLETGALVGAEALLRWNHPVKGMIPPEKFIPLAEENGLINDIGDWVLSDVCRQGRRWLDAGIDFGRIAVNIASSQISHGGLPDLVQCALHNSAFPAEHLELEITEGFVIQNIDSAIDQLHSLRNMGITMAIDDFGTGYSSLSYLKQLPINKVKIDKSFVHDIPGNIDDRAIVDAIIAMGISLGMTVIAEGVETWEHQNYLKQAGCHEAQGYLYSRPLSSAAYREWLDQFTLHHD